MSKLEVLRDCSADAPDKIKAAIETAFEAHELHYGVKITAAKIHDNREVFFSFSTNDAKDQIGQFTLRQFPQCRHLIVSTHVWVAEKFRGRGYGKQFNDLRTRAMSLAGFSKILATVDDSNEVEIKILADAGWSRISSFSSKDGYDGGSKFGLWERIL